MTDVKFPQPPVSPLQAICNRDPQSPSYTRRSVSQLAMSQVLTERSPSSGGTYEYQMSLPTSPRKVPLHCPESPGGPPVVALLLLMSLSPTKTGTDPEQSSLAGGGPGGAWPQTSSDIPTAIIAAATWSASLCVKRVPGLPVRGSLGLELSRSVAAWLMKVSACGNAVPEVMYTVRARK